MKKFLFFAALATACAAASAQAHDALVLKAKQNITWDLRDPSSAQFRGLFVSKLGDALVICGEMNAKNAYGGYVGFRRFTASDDRNLQDLEPEPGSLLAVFNATWATRCSDRIAAVD